MGHVRLTDSDWFHHVLCGCNLLQHPCQDPWYPHTLFATNRSRTAKKLQKNWTWIHTHGQVGICSTCMCWYSLEYERLCVKYMQIPQCKLCTCTLCVIILLHKITLYLLQYMRKSSLKTVLCKDAKKWPKQVADIQRNALLHPYFTLMCNSTT